MQVSNVLSNFSLPLFPRTNTDAARRLKAFPSSGGAKPVNYSTNYGHVGVIAAKG